VNAPVAAPTAPATRQRSEELHASALATRVLLVGNMVSKFLRFLTDVVLARALGPEGFGVVAASMSFTHILAEVGLVGTHRGVLRFASLDESAGRPRAAAALTRRGLTIAGLFGGVLFVAVLVARRPLTRLLFEETTSVWILPAFALAIPAIGAFTVLQFRARAARRFGDDSLVGNVARAAVPFLLTAVLLFAGWKLWGAVAGFVGGMIGTAGLAVLLQRRADRRARATTGAAEDVPIGLGRLMRVAVPLALAGASILIMNELDKVMLAIFWPETEVGLYNAGFRLSRQAILLLPVVNAAISPFVGPLLAAGRHEDLHRLYRDTTRWSLAAGWSAALLFTVFAADFVGLFGPEYADATSVLVLLSLGQLVNASVGNAGVILQFSGHEKMELSNGVLVTVVNFVLNLALIPGHGAEGAALATLLSLVLVAVRRVFQTRKALGIMPYDRRAVHVLVGGAIGAAVGWGLRMLVHALGGGAAPCVLAATLGMFGSWTVLLMKFGVTEEEAALLRVPRSWVKRSDPVGSRTASRWRGGSDRG
jgi:O-antigen/teichoic acid export membrane protein